MVASPELFVIPPLRRALRSEQAPDLLRDQLASVEEKLRQNGVAGYAWLADLWPTRCWARTGGAVEPTDEPRSTIVEDIPVVASETVKHVAHVGRCKRCGQQVSEPLPGQTPHGQSVARTQLGPNATAMAASRPSSIGATCPQTITGPSATSVCSPRSQGDPRDSSGPGKQDA